MNTKLPVEQEKGLIRIEGSMHFMDLEGRNFWELRSVRAEDVGPQMIFVLKNPPQDLQQEDIRVACDLEPFPGADTSARMRGIDATVVHFELR